MAYTPVFVNHRPIAGLPTGGRGNNPAHSALRAAANKRRDLFSGSGKSDLGRLGIKEGYSFTGGEGKVLVDSIQYPGSGYDNGGYLNIYGPAPSQAAQTQTTTDNTTTTSGGGSSGGGGGPSGGGGSQQTDVTPYEGIEFPDYSDQFSNMNKTIADLTSSFNSLLGAMTTKMNADRLAAEERMAEMQQSFQQQLAARKERPRVSGIRFADRGTGGKSTMQLTRKGVRGTFGRSGDRLMKISSLNI